MATTKRSRVKGIVNQVQNMAVTEDSLITCGMDDTVVFTSTHSNEYKLVFSLLQACSPFMPRKVYCNVQLTFLVTI